MIFVGIDVAKDKHDCLIISSEGEVLADVFTISNSKEGFEHLLQTINRRIKVVEISNLSNDHRSHAKTDAWNSCNRRVNLIHYESGQLNNCYAHMEKRGSRYLRYTIFNATKFVCNWNPLFADYLAKKRSEGKHYNVAISHAAKKLVRLIFALQKSGQSYIAKN